MTKVLNKGKNGSGKKAQKIAEKQGSTKFMNRVEARRAKRAAKEVTNLVSSKTTPLPAAAVASVELNNVRAKPMSDEVVINRKAEKKAARKAAKRERKLLEAAQTSLVKKEKENSGAVNTIVTQGELIANPNPWKEEPQPAGSEVCIFTKNPHVEFGQMVTVNLRDFQGTQPPKGNQEFYAVRVGRIPGIYQSWSEAGAQTNGHSGALFKKFKNFRDAEIFMGW